MCVLFALPVDHHEFAGHDPSRELPALNVRLNIQDETRPLTEITFVKSNCRVTDPDVLERFLTAALVFLGQPKLVSERADRQREQRAQAANRARGKRGFAPLETVREIKLNLEVPAFRQTGGSHGAGGGGGRHGTALHSVRAFWRFRRGVGLEIVRFHWRGDARFGVSKRRYNLDLGGGSAEGALRRAQEAVRDIPDERPAPRRR